MKKLLLLCFALVLFGCSKDNLEQIKEGQIPETESTTKAGSTVFEKTDFGTPLTLGDKIQNPYSVKNLRKTSASNGPATRGNLPESDIVPTHRYIRFLPANTIEYTLLLKTVRSFPFPLDREIVTNGTFYRDPDPANEGKIYSWQYAVVPVEQQLPDVTYEILDELYMPENKDGNNKNNLTKLGSPGQNTVIVRVWDNSVNFNRFVPVKGLMVSAVDLDKGASMAYGITDETGTAIMNTSFPVTENTFYCIFWNDGIGWKWITTDTNLNQLFYNAKAVVGTTYIDIKNTREHEMIEQSLATIHRAAYRTYYKTNSDLLPPANEETIQIAYDDTHCEKGAKGRCYAYVPGVSKINVRIHGRTKGGNLYNTREIFSTTVHELGHLNHNVGFPAAFSSDKIIIESWARCVQKYLTQYEYEEYGLSLFKTELLPYLGAPGPPGQTVKKEFVVPNSLNCQKWPFIFSDNILAEISQKELPYSPIFIDLIDDENQRQYYQGIYLQKNSPTTSTDEYLRFPQDNVKNFTIGELQGLLKNTYTLEQLREKVKGLSNLHGNSVSSINTLFSKYIEYWNLYVPSKSANGLTGPDGGIVLSD